jgi:hypothetical protein
MTSQQLGDLALEEHRAVMAAHYRDCINRPTEDQYEALLDQLRKELSCPEITCSPSSSLSQGASQ